MRNVDHERREYGREQQDQEQPPYYQVEQDLLRAAREFDACMHAARGSGSPLVQSTSAPFLTRGSSTSILPSGGSPKTPSGPRTSPGVTHRAPRATKDEPREPCKGWSLPAHLQPASPRPPKTSPPPRSPRRVSGLGGLAEHAPPRCGHGASSAASEAKASKEQLVAHPARLERALHYKRAGSASHRSSSERFGNFNDLAMLGVPQAANPGSHRCEGERPSVHRYLPLRDQHGTHFEVARKAASRWDLPATF